jgi:signal transduction histidine kinase
LVVRSRDVAVLEVTDRTGRGVAADAIDALRRFLAQVGLALETHLSGSALLLDALSLDARRDEVRTELHRLDARPLPDATALRDGLNALAATVVGLTKATGCTIHLVESDALRTLGSSGLPDSLVHELDAATRQGAGHPALHVVATGRDLVVVNERSRLMTDPRFRRAHALLEHQPWDAVGGIPLTAAGAVRGALCYYFSPADRPDEAGFRTLRALAARAGQLLDSAELVTTTNRRAAAEERQRLARELHDSVSQALYGVALGARTALARLDQDEGALARDAVSYVVRQAEAGAAELRALIFELIPHSLEEEGLAAALTKHAAALQARYRVTVEVQADPTTSAAVEAQHELYRIAQEATHNAIAHGPCTHITVRLRAEGDDIVIEVVDDGGGFDPAASYPGHLGLHSMRERAALLGGTCQVVSRPGRTRVTATVPHHPSLGDAPA